MKKYRFLGISILLHAALLALLLVRFNFGYYNMKDASFVQLDRARVEMNPPKPFILGDEDSTNKKPVINTNFQELQKDNDSGGGSQDFSGYVPSYQVEELPIPLSPISPKYPEEARRTGLEGKVLVLLYIDEMGNVKKVEVQKSPSEILSRSAVEAVSSARFKPARIAGAARAVCMLLTLKFHLE
jgi:TonB family protein